MQQRRTFLIGVLLLVVLVLSACVPSAQPDGGETQPAEPLAEESTETESEQEEEAAPQPTPIEPVAIDEETYRVLQNTEVPENDFLDLALRFRGLEEVPAPIAPPVQPLEVGAQQTFTVSNDRDEQFEVQATLQAVTDHSYFWVDDTAQFDQDAISKLARSFESKIYPTNRSFFGSEPTPGVDGDEHLYILFARRLGIYIGGYFSTVDVVHPAVRPDSNGHEMFVINIDNVPPDAAAGVLAHEFQHMIHWYNDRNETSWLNEGMAELAQLLNREYDSGPDREYTNNPDLQLNTWPLEEDTFPYYGAAFLFSSYFRDRFGEEATQALATHPANGLDSVDAVLQELSFSDPLTGAQLTADDVVLDWTLANFLNDDAVGDGRYLHDGYKFVPPVRWTDKVSECSPEPLAYDVHQFGVDYIQVTCPGEYTLHFDGAEHTTLVPVDAYSGDYFFYSNKADESDMMLTRAFDFTGVEGSLTFSFMTSYQIEEGWDYAYLEISADDGETWTILETPSGTDKDPQGSNLGWGWTGETRGMEWMQESIDLSAYAGQQVLIRFEYVTDAAVYGEGMFIDDISIPEIDYFEDFETGDGSWQAAGWARVKNVLPQYFRLALIRNSDGDTTVEYIDLGTNNTANIDFSVQAEGESVVLVVLGTTRYTQALADYTISFSAR